MPSRPNAEGPPGGVNISGTVGLTGDIVGRDSIKIGLDEKETGQRVGEALGPVQEQLANLTMQIAREKGVELLSLRAILTRLGEVGVPDHEIPARLDAAADELVELRLQYGRLSNERPEFAGIRNQALGFINQGKFYDARAVLARGRELARARREHMSRNEAEFLADEARIHHLEFAYREAAEKYAQAAGLTESFDQNVQWSYLKQQAHELYVQGLVNVDNPALHASVSLLEGLANHPILEREPDKRTGLQNDLGVSLTILGERDRKSDYLDRAVAAFDAALQLWTADQSPLNWALAQNNRGKALARLGDRDTTNERLKQAIAAFRGVLNVWTMDEQLLDWAMAKNNLGLAIAKLVAREGTRFDRLEQAVAAFRDVLLVLTPNRALHEWVAAHLNLGSALVQIGKQRQRRTKRIRDAIAVYRDALKVCTRERFSVMWAMLNDNLAVALRLVGERLNDPSFLNKAIAANDAALEIFTCEGTPPDWAAAQNNRGLALAALGRLDQAVGAYNAALTVWTPDKTPHQWAETQDYLGLALARLGRLQEAVEVWERWLAAATTFAPQEWIQTVRLNIDSTQAEIRRRVGQ